MYKAYCFPNRKNLIKIHAKWNDWSNMAIPFILPCGCGTHFDWCAGWQEVPLYAAAHQSVLAWTAVESLTPGLQSYSFPRKI